MISPLVSKMCWVSSYEKRWSEKITVLPNHWLTTCVFSVISNTAEKVYFSSLGLNEQAKLDKTSGNIGTTLSTKYTEVALW